MLTIHHPLQYIDIIQHDNHFYEFTFKVGSRAALDELFIYIEQLLQLPADTKVKIIVDTTQCSAPPMTYAFNLGQTLMRKYPNRPKPIRVVFLDNEKQKPMQQIMQAFIAIINPFDKTTHIYGEKRDTALDFLFKEEPEKHPNYVE